jgi:hypothetical protein
MIISRGLGGNGGKRSMITARGGAGSGGKCLRTEKRVVFEVSGEIFYVPSYHFCCQS